MLNNNAELDKKLLVSESIRAIEKEKDELASKLQNKDLEKQLLEKSLHEKHADEIRLKDEIIRMKEKIKSVEIFGRNMSIS